MEYKLCDIPGMLGCSIKAIGMRIWRYDIPHTKRGYYNEEAIERMRTCLKRAPRKWKKKPVDVTMCTFRKNSGLTCKGCIEEGRCKK